MGLRGVNRIMIAVHDLDKAKQQYSDLLGATFVDAHWTGEPFGISVSIAWDAGIELCAPLPGRET
jgi:catechol 2,3-dioxygenase-like lactoylglutathione lyase family enzyme